MSDRNKAKFSPISKGKKLQIERMNKGNWGKVRAFVDIRTKEGFVIKGFRLIEGINGLFISFPSQKGNDNEYYDTVWAERELKDELTQLVVKEYGGDIMSGGPSSGPDSFPGVPDSAPPDNGPEPFSDDDIPF